MAASFYADNRKVRNDRLVRHLGYRLLYPTYRDGLAAQLAALPFWLWLGSSIGLFVVGWVLQFIGHYFEGKKPAFVDDLVGLLIGPLFVMAEVLFLLGFAKSLQQQIDQSAGPVHK